MSFGGEKCLETVTLKYRTGYSDNNKTDMNKQYVSDTNWLRVGLEILVFFFSKHR